MPFADALSHEITEAMVYEAIADVLDPELDESLVKLGFIDHVRINGGDITVVFKLPTYWCAPNFAYLMAADLRAKVLAIPGVDAAHILLQDHCTEGEINTSINTGKSFTEAFPDEAQDNLEELRQIFLRKGFLMRQDMLLRKLQKAGIGEAMLLSLRVADLFIDEDTQRATITAPTQVIHLERTAQTARAYLRRAALLSLHHGPHSLLFIDDHGQAIPAGELQHYLRQSRSVRMNIMFNTVFCSDMFQTRYGSGEKKLLPEGETI